MEYPRAYQARENHLFEQAKIIKRPAIFVDRLIDIIPGEHGYNVNLRIV